MHVHIRFTRRREIRLTSGFVTEEEGRENDDNDDKAMALGQAGVSCNRAELQQGRASTKAITHRLLKLYLIRYCIIRASSLPVLRAAPVDEYFSTVNLSHLTQC